MSEQSITELRLITVTTANAGQRIDNFLLTLLKGVPRSRIYRILRKGEVRVNRKRSRPELRLEVGDLVRVPPLRLPTPGEAAKIPSSALEMLERSIIREEDEYLIVNKPAGLAVHGGSGEPWGVIEMLREIYPSSEFLDLAHRIDKHTSGCLLVARKRSVLVSLHAQWRTGDVDKSYQALVAGKISWARKKIDVPLRKNAMSSGERIVVADPEGKPALSEFSVRERLEGATLLDAVPITGRTHQLRVHAQSMGRPIIGDEKYGDSAINRHFQRKGLMRMYLHASTMRFNLNGRNIQITAPLPPEFEEAIETLRKG